MNDNFCMCGIQAGYAHRPGCPYPYFGNEPLEMKKWQTAYMEGVSHTKRMRVFLNDIPDQEYAPCGCWKSKRNGETFIFCIKHLREGSK